MVPIMSIRLMLALICPLSVAAGSAQRTTPTWNASLGQLPQDACPP